ncbi:MAG TPA: ABC transporter permease [Chloroflexota bacterium]|nr:ABC transporter permease [Chloroflexota bacterium]
MSQLAIAPEAVTLDLKIEQPARNAAWRSLRKTTRSILRHKGARLGLFVFGAFVLMAILSPWIVPYDPNAQNAALGIGPPSLAHPFGTDVFGRDILSRVIDASKLSLLIAFASVAISVAGGVTLGMLTGYFQGWLDAILMRCMDVLLSFPGLVLALVLAAIMGPGLQSVIVAVGIAGIPTFARVSRGAVLSVRNNDYVEAARSIGCASGQVIRRHVLPNTLAPIIVLTTLYVAFAVLTASSLSFLGVGVRPPTAEWGSMTNEGRGILQVAWWVSTFPGLMIMLLVLSANLVGDAVRDTLDPTLQV